MKNLFKNLIAFFSKKDVDPRKKRLDDMFNMFVDSKNWSSNSLYNPEHHG
jgi:hypothetical protein